MSRWRSKNVAKEEPPRRAEAAVSKTAFLPKRRALLLKRFLEAEAKAGTNNRDAVEGYKITRIGVVR